MTPPSAGADRDKQTGLSQDMTGDGVIGTGPFAQDLHRTPVALWWAVGLMSLGAVLVGAALVAFSRSNAVAIGLLLAGVLVGLVGVVLGLKRKIMSNVD